MNPLKRLFGTKNKTAIIASSPAEVAAQVVIETLVNMSTTTTTTMTGPPTAAGSSTTDQFGGGPVVTIMIQYLLGTSYMTAEWQALTMAIQGCMIVRNGVNKTNQLHWFHAFVLSMLYGFAGGLLGFIWLGKPSSLLSSGDINLGACIIAYIVVNYTPFDIGYHLLNTLPGTILYTSGAQLFRATGLIRFVTACFTEFKHAPSPYYPIPVLGPILYGTVRLFFFFFVCLFCLLLTSGVVTTKKNDDHHDDD
jgi:TRIC channel